jgi:DNA-binding GntR family transcriptional regulator
LKRQVTSPLPGFRVDRSLRTPLAAQIGDFIRAAIRDGTAPPRGLLPSSRTLAARLGVSRNTVLQAYETLCFEGLLTARSGSGTRVDGPASVRPHRTISLETILRESNYPLRVRELLDPDGNPVTIHY